MSLTLHRYHSDHHSGVKAYGIEQGYVEVLFPPDKDGATYIYKYSNHKPGRQHVEKMKALAKKGSGLTTYINQHVRENYERRYEGDKVVIID